MAKYFVRTYAVIAMLNTFCGLWALADGTFDEAQTHAQHVVVEWLVPHPPRRSSDHRPDDA